MKPTVRCATTPEGAIEATVGLQNRIIINRRTGEVLFSTAREGTDMFRWLVRAARQHCNP